MGSGAAAFRLAGSLTSGREARCGDRMGTEQTNWGKVSNQVIYSEGRKNSLCQAHSCSAEAREAVQILNGGEEVGR